VHDLLTTVLVAAAAFVGTTFDNFFALAAQLALTPQDRFRRIGRAHVASVITLIGIAGGVGGALSSIPLHAVALLGLVPFSLGLYAWRHRHDEVAPTFRRGATTTFLVSVALGGDNIAVWVPILRAAGVARGLETAGVFVLLELVLVYLAQSVARRQAVVAWGQANARRLTPFLYTALSVLIIAECGWW